MEARLDRDRSRPRRGHASGACPASSICTICTCGRSPTASTLLTVHVVLGQGLPRHRPWPPRWPGGCAKKHALKHCTVQPGRSRKSAGDAQAAGRQGAARGQGPRATGAALSGGHPRRIRAHLDVFGAQRTRVRFRAENADLGPSPVRVTAARRRAVRGRLSAASLRALAPRHAASTLPRWSPVRRESPSASASARSHRNIAFAIARSLRVLNSQTAAWHTSACS